MFFSRFFLLFIILVGLLLCPSNKSATPELSRANKGHRKESDRQCPHRHPPLPFPPVSFYSPGLFLSFCLILPQMGFCNYYFIFPSWRTILLGALLPRLLCFSDPPTPQISMVIIGDVSFQVISFEINRNSIDFQILAQFLSISDSIQLYLQGYEF